MTEPQHEDNEPSTEDVVEATPTLHQEPLSDVTASGSQVTAEPVTQAAEAVERVEPAAAEAVERAAVAEAVEPVAEAVEPVAEAVEPVAEAVEPEAAAEASDAQEPARAGSVTDVLEPKAEPREVEAAALSVEPEPVVEADAEPVAAATHVEALGALTEDDLAEAPSAEPEPIRPAAPRPEPTTMEELLSEQSGEIRSLKHGDVVEGTVVRIDKDEILVDIGAKSEGVVSNRELYGRNTETQPQLNIGDVVLVYVLQPESNEGHAVLSLRRAGLERKWRSMQEQFETGVIIEAPVIDHNKGGLIVDCGIRGFVPISQIVDFPRRPQNEQPRDAAQEIAEKLQPYVGRKLRLKILEVNRKANRLILSEKVALYEERREKRDELFSSLKVGQQVKGSVRSIAPFGVFVDLGGIDGLVHKSELSWNKVNNPESGYHVGEEVEAEVIDINHERGRISLSIRRLQPDPWSSTVADLKQGDIIEGTVTKIVNFGAFVRVREGLEGLIHISELSHQRVAHPGDVVHEGQRLNLKVISLDSERHRLGLSLKQAEEAPARPAVETRERRPRTERAFDPSQAVQEPEGGIDNTLAAAFAQVRQQIAEQDAARARGEEPVPLDPASIALVEEATAVAEAEEAAEDALVSEAVTVALAEDAAEEAVLDEAVAVADAEDVAEEALGEEVAALAVAEDRAEEALAEEIVSLAEAETDAEAALAAAAPSMTADELSDAQADLADAEMAAEGALTDDIAAVVDAEAVAEADVADDVADVAAAEQAAESDLNDDEADVAEAELAAESDLNDDEADVAQAEMSAEAAVKADAAAVVRATDAE